MDFFDPGSTTKAVIFACSPRAAGNSDTAARLIAKGIAEAGGQSQLVTLRQYRVSPCLGCRRCEYDPNRQCFQARDDQSGSLFQTLLSAPLVFFVSPIYFYHLPSGFKAFIDRGQSFYLRMLDKDPELLALRHRKAHVCLIAGRTQGEHLFAGSLLTLRYFLQPFRLELAEPLLLRGLDDAQDLKGKTSFQDQLLELGATAWRGAATAAAATATPQPSGE